MKKTQAGEVGRQIKAFVTKLEDQTEFDELNCQNSQRKRREVAPEKRTLTFTSEPRHTCLHVLTIIINKT